MLPFLKQRLAFVSYKHLATLHLARFFLVFKSTCSIYPHNKDKEKEDAQS